MQTHHIKLNQNYCKAVYDGEKTFEIRYNDRGYQKGDRVYFTPVDDEGCAIPHPVARCTYEIAYVLSGWGLKENWCAFGIRPLENK